MIEVGISAAHGAPPLRYFQVFDAGEASVEGERATGTGNGVNLFFGKMNCPQAVTEVIE